MLSNLDSKRTFLPAHDIPFTEYIFFPDISRSLSASIFFTQFGQTGEQIVYTEHCGQEVMYHVASLLPFPQTDPK